MDNQLEIIRTLRNDNKSWSQIANKLNSMGEKTVTGKRFTRSNAASMFYYKSPKSPRAAAGEDYDFLVNWAKHILNAPQESSKNKWSALKQFTGF